MASKLVLATFPGDFRAFKVQIAARCNGTDLAVDGQALEWGQPMVLQTPEGESRLLAAGFAWPPHSTCSACQPCAPRISR